MLRTRSFFMVAGLVLLSAFALGPAPLQAAGPAMWSIQPTPNPAGANSVLNSVSCSDRRACTAVGYSIVNNRAMLPLIERWDGSHWAIEPVPSPAGSKSVGLYGVSCSGARSCVAVGFADTPSTAFYALSEVWNGTRWRIVPPAVPAGTSGSGFTAVSCLSWNACTAVGGYNLGSNQEQPLAEYWNGSTWSIQSVPNPHAENGSTALGVSCTSQTACTAVAIYAYADVDQSVFALQWNGTVWTQVTQPNPGGQANNSEYSVSCSVQTACTSVGTWTNVGSLPLAERWDGTRWTRQGVGQPKGAAQTTMSGVSCAAAAACMSVGSWSTSLNGLPSYTLAERWDGTHWAVSPTPNPTGATVNTLSSVSCTSPTICIAVGGYYASGVNYTLAEIYAA